MSAAYRAARSVHGPYSVVPSVPTASHYDSAFFPVLDPDRSARFVAPALSYAVACPLVSLAFVRAPACFAMVAFVSPIRPSMLWTREGTRVCLYSFSALADPVHVSVPHTMIAGLG